MDFHNHSQNSAGCIRSLSESVLNQCDTIEYVLEVGLDNLQDHSDMEDGMEIIIVALKYWDRVN